MHAEIPLCPCQRPPILRHEWLGGVTAGCQTNDSMVMGSIPGGNTIKWLLLGWVTVCKEVNRLNI